MINFNVEEVELAREIVRKLGKEIEQSQLPEDGIESKLASIDSVEEMMVEKLRELLK